MHVSDSFSVSSCDCFHVHLTNQFYNAGVLSLTKSLHYHPQNLHHSLNKLMLRVLKSGDKMGLVWSKLYKASNVSFFYAAIQNTIYNF